MAMSSSITGFGSVTEAPSLPEGFTDTFSSHLVYANGINFHVVTGGHGSALLLLGGWPQNWYAWRHLMPALAQNFTVIAVDPRGVGLSDKPDTGYDGETLAQDMFALMTALGHQQFSMAGHDIGMWVGYTMIASHPERIRKIALGEALIPGISDSPPLISDERHLSDFLWHFNFNRTLGINEDLVKDREDIYFGYQFATKSGKPDALPPEAIHFYIESIKRDPKALKASFDYYRAIDQSIPQYRERAKKRVTDIPILAFAGALSCGEGVEIELRSIADNVESLMLNNCGHYPAEEQPDELLSAFQRFFIADDK